MPYKEHSKGRASHKVNLMGGNRSSGVSQAEGNAGQIVLYSDAKSNPSQFSGISPIKNYSDIAKVAKAVKHDQKISN